MGISIITTSINRKQELARFCNSINEQRGINYEDIQLIFVDQGDNKNVLNTLDAKIDVTYVKHPPCSLSKARNIAIPYVKNEIVAFGDDDCWYDKDCLKIVFNKIFVEGLDGVIGQSLNESGKNNVPSPCKQVKLGVYKHPGAISYTIFLRYDSSLRFDENIGVGSPYGLSSGEETDYLIQYIRKHENVFYDPALIIFHPEKLTSYFDDFFQKNFLYSKGFGYLLKKQNYPLAQKLRSFIRPFGGIFIYLLLGNLLYAKRSFYILKGRLIGYFTNIIKEK